MEKQRILRCINLTILSILVIYPLILVVLGGFYIKKYGLGISEIRLFLAGYYFSQIIVCLAMHRLWSHGAFKTNKFVEFILALFAAGLLQGSTLAWVSMHYLHHRFTDTEKDPHSPIKYNNKIIGFLWSHVGWLFKGRDELKSYNHINKAVIARLGKNKILMWQYKYYFPIALFMNTLVPGLVGYFCGNFEVTSAYSGFLFIGLGRSLQHHMTFCVNSICHLFGNKQYTKSSAGDVGWLSIFLLGENWHNFHHAFPSDYRNGVKWYQIDVIKWIIYIMNKIGLAQDLIRTDKARINAKVEYSNL